MTRQLSGNKSFPLLVSLLMLPQIAEAIYSPALSHLVRDFSVSASQASLTLSLFFGGFASAVVFWGPLSDVIGRRRTMLAGLFLFAGFSLLAVFANQFWILLLARLGGAFSISVCSIVGQTLLRDQFQGIELSRRYATTGVGIAISPAIGLLIGGSAAALNGSQGVFLMLLSLGSMAFLWSLARLPETLENSDKIQKNGKFGSIRILYKSLATSMHIVLHDRKLRNSTLLIAFMNILVFSYYSLVPFVFEGAGLTSDQFGVSGLLLTLGALIGGFLNRYLLTKNHCSESITLLGYKIAFAASFGVIFLQESFYIVIPYIVIMISFTLTIPNILSLALKNYHHNIGTLGAVFGLVYYCLIAIGLAVVGHVGELGFIVFVCSCMGLILVKFTFRKASLGNVKRRKVTGLPSLCF